jgi:hypothetical protein
LVIVDSPLLIAVTGGLAALLLPAHGMVEL